MNPSQKQKHAKIEDAPDNHDDDDEYRYKRKHKHAKIESERSKDQPLLPQLTGIIVRPTCQVKLSREKIFTFVGCTQAPPTRKTTDVCNVSTNTITLSRAAATGITTPMLTLLYADTESVYPDDIIPTACLQAEYHNLSGPHDEHFLQFPRTTYDIRSTSGIDMDVLVKLAKARPGGENAVMKFHTKLLRRDANGKIYPDTAAGLCMRSYPYQYLCTELLAGAFVSKPMLWLRIVLGEFYINAVDTRYARHWWECLRTCPVVLTFPGVIPGKWFSCLEMRTVMVHSFSPKAQVLAWLDARHARRIPARPVLDADQWQTVLNVARRVATKTHSVIVISEEDEILVPHLTTIPFYVPLVHPVEVYDAKTKKTKRATIFTAHPWTNPVLYATTSATFEWTARAEKLDHCVEFVNVQVVFKPHRADHAAGAAVLSETLHQSASGFESVFFVTADLDAAVSYYHPAAHQMRKSVTIISVSATYICPNGLAKLAFIRPINAAGTDKVPKSTDDHRAIVVVDNAHEISQQTIMRIVEWIRVEQKMAVDKLVIMLDPLFLAGSAGQWATDLLHSNYYSAVAAIATGFPGRVQDNSTILPGFRHINDSTDVFQPSAYTAVFQPSVYPAKSRRDATIVPDDIADPRDQYTRSRFTYHACSSLDALVGFTSTFGSGATGKPSIAYIECDESVFEAASPGKHDKDPRSHSAFYTKMHHFAQSTYSVWHRDVLAWSENSSNTRASVGDTIAVPRPESMASPWPSHSARMDHFALVDLYPDQSTSAASEAGVTHGCPVNADAAYDTCKTCISVVILAIRTRSYKHEPSLRDPQLPRPDEFISYIHTKSTLTTTTTFDRADEDHRAFGTDMHLVEADVYDPVSKTQWTVMLFFKHSRAAAIATYSRSLEDEGRAWGATATRLFDMYVRKSLSWRNISIRDPASTVKSQLAPPIATEYITVILDNKSFYSLATIWTACHTATKAVFVLYLAGHKILDTLYAPTTTPIPRIRTELGYPKFVQDANDANDADDTNTNDDFGDSAVM